MSTTEHEMHCAPSNVFAVLSDGWLLAGWVVGASRIRDVDAGWPLPGSNAHHSVGVWPALIDDATTVVEMVPDRSLRLKARAWPAGEAVVQITLEPSPTGTVVTIVEDATAGPGTLMPRPIRDFFLDRRNRESLRRLAFLAENREVQQ